MSRTFRRRYYETQYGKKKGSKTNGFYTEWDTCTVTGNGHGGYWNFRPMTSQEKAKEYWRIHGESKHHNAWSPSVFYRRRYTAGRKHWNRMEMIRYLNDPTNYDPQFLAKDQNCWWDWR